MVANEHAVWVRMYVNGGIVYSLAIMVDNDILQTKYIAFMLWSDITISSTSIDDSVYIVINNVTKNMGTTYNDAMMVKELIGITINDEYYSDSQGTWTSTIEPDNVTVKLNCKIVDNSTSVIISKCDSKTTWGESVFNRIPIRLGGIACFGFDSTINHVMFGTDILPIEGSAHSSWNESIRYDVTSDGSSLVLGNQVTIKDLPESFVSHWTDMGAEALMDTGHAILIPPDA